MIKRFIVMAKEFRKNDSERLVEMLKELEKNNEIFFIMASITKKTYDELVKVGFTEDQAMRIIIAAQESSAGMKTS